MADTTIPSYIMEELENTSKIFRVPLHFLKDIYVLGLLQGHMRGRKDAAADFNKIVTGVAK